MSNAKRKTPSGRRPVGKTAVAGVKDRVTNQVAAQVVAFTGKETLQGFVIAHASDGATVCSDEAAAYDGLPRTHEPVKHSDQE